MTLPNHNSEFSDGLTAYARNCGCGGVLVLYDKYTAKCGACNASRKTQAAINRDYYARLEAEAAENESNNG